MGYTHLFGPVSSRRLGRSLGVDLVAYKVCSFDCVYCEVGSTTNKTITRQDFFPPSEVEEELMRFFSGEPSLDYLTLSGSGEPTISLSLGRVISFIKTNFPAYPLAVLTNGSLLWDREVQQELLPADVVLPTLCTVDEETFQKIHRPAPGLTIKKIIGGLRNFRRIYSGEIWLEVFLIPGINMDRDHLSALGDEIRRIHPDRVQLNTLDRPGTEPWVRPASPQELQDAARSLGLPGAESIHPAATHGPRVRAPADPASAVVEMIQRRPCTVEDIVQATGLHRQEVGKLLRTLSRDPRLKTKREERGTFYSWVGD
ncbi:MAG: molybdenum cofactor biosynthesis protein A [Methanoregulaceae archaeon PtaB.Bin056]|nr:MAG: molybdenum cofactor biosynthesis protein A [Methanoregulaceae archaeon PtaB.Bin056]